MSLTCWKCKKEMPSGQRFCPHCNAPVDPGMVDQMKTMYRDSSPGIQIVPGVIIAGRYEVMRELGRGGMGVVYLALDRELDRNVALKVIPTEFSQDPRAVENLKRETTIALDLTHEHIVHFYNLDTWEGQAFVTMEYVDGGTLAHLLADKGGKLSLKEALPFLEQMAAALDYAHRQKPPVVHRDIKPLNMLLTGDGLIKVVDFGLARVLQDSATRVTRQTTAGTLAYMAPEQVRGKGIGPWTDIYAFACVAYEMLEGVPPYHTGDLLWQIMNEPPEPIQGVPGYVNEALRAGLGKDPQARPESAGALVEMLAGKMKVKGGGRGPSKKKGKKAKRGGAGAGASTSASQGMRGKGLWKYLAVAAVVLSVIAAVVFWWLNPMFGDAPVLTVESTPPEAVFYLDDHKMGLTPMELKRLSDGVHKIRLTKDKYQDHKESVFVEQGKTCEVEAGLEPLPIGDAEMTSEPVGAEVYVDGTFMGKTPLELTGLKKGKRKVRFSKKGYEERYEEVEIVPLKKASLHGILEGLYGGLKVTSKPEGASVYVNGAKKGQTQPCIGADEVGDNIGNL